VLGAKITSVFKICSSFFARRTNSTKKGHARLYCAGGTELEKGADFGIDADVGGGIAADQVEAAAVEGEVDEAADVVVLVERSEELDGFFRVEGERFEGDGIAPLFGERGVAVDYFFKTQHFGSAAGSARANLLGARILPCGVYRAPSEGGSAQIGGRGEIR
jgi:hypothetical protein